MEENDAMEEKDLALNEVIKEAFEMKKESDQKGENTFVNPVLQIGETAFEIDIKKDNKDNLYKMHILGVHILTLDENNELQFEQGWEDALSIRIKECSGMVSEKDGKDLIENLKQVDKELQKEREEEQKDEKDLSDDMEEKDEKEEEPEEDKTEDESKEEIARKHNVKSNQVIHVSMDRRITDNDRFQGLAKWAREYDDIYVLPGKDEYSWDTIGINKDGEEEVINNRQQEGKNPDVTIKRVDGNEITEVRPIAMYEIDSKQSYAVIRDSSGKTQMLYCRQEEGDGKAFWGIGVPEADTKNVREKSVEGREFMDSRNNSSYDLAKKGDELEKGADLEERGIPSKEGKGVQTEEIEGTARQNRQLRKEDIIEDLLKRDGIIDRAKAMPGFYENKAEKVLTLMETDDKITYEDAVKRVEDSGRAAEGNTPDQGPRRREH